MISEDPDPAQLQQQKNLLESPVGQRGSGAARYGAAMFFYQEKMMSAELLEIYRRCCKFDHEDPVDLAAFEGIPNALLLDQ
nr:hypothetical protein [Roseovarius sp. W115]MDV2929676.1 hypothetical protein [Roseovarius sp. W115]